MAKFQEIFRNQGVDNLPPGKDWMMVPEGGDNHVRLVDGAGFDVQSAKPHHHITVHEVRSNQRVVLLKHLGATIPQTDRIFKVHGTSAGPATIIAKKASDSLKIEVSVKSKQTYSVAFFFVQDPAAPGGTATTRSTFAASTTDAWITGLNNVFTPQANLSFEKVKNGVASLPIANLPAEIGPDQAKGLLDEGVKLIKEGDIKIFLAGPKIRTQDTSHLSGFYHVETKIIIMRDLAPQAGQTGDPMVKTMAHEIGHWLTAKRGAGQGHDFYMTVGYKSDILNTLDPSDIKIPRQRVLDWNGS